MSHLFEYGPYLFLAVWICVALYKTLQNFQAMKDDHSQQFNLFELIGNLFYELIKSFVTLFVLCVLAGGAIYILWLLLEEIFA
jgi:flagellar biosynthesis protein FlhB